MPIDAHSPVAHTSRHVRSNLRLCQCSFRLSVPHAFHTLVCMLSPVLTPVASITIEYMVDAESGFTSFERLSELITSIAPECTLKGSEKIWVAKSIHGRVHASLCQWGTCMFRILCDRWPARALHFNTITGVRICMSIRRQNNTLVCVCVCVCVSTWVQQG